MQVEIAEIIPYRISLESQAKNEPSEAVPGINPHHVPENRMFTNGHHGFGPKLGFFLDASPKPAAQNQDGNI
jgi:hypothetical protein